MKRVVPFQVALTVCMIVALSHVCALPTTDEQMSGSIDVLLQHLTGIIESFHANFANLKRRPIYNVAHMVNADSQVNLDWVNNANAIESDLEFKADGSPDRFHHGSPCDCGRTCSYKGDVIAHLNTIRRKAQDKSQNFALFWIDLKLGSSRITDFFSSGKKMAEIMTRSGSLFPPGEDVPVNVLLGAETLDQKDFFLGFRQYISKNRPQLLQKFGYDFSSTSNSVDKILDTFNELGIRENIWIGDGITNCLPRSTSRIKKILAKRDSYHGSGLAPFKVYAWTFDKTSSMREYLQLGVDAIIVNYPDRMKALVKDEFHDSLTLATRATDPWERIKASEAIPPLAQGCQSSTCWKYTTPYDWCWTTTISAAKQGIVGGTLSVVQPEIGSAYLQLISLEY